MTEAEILSSFMELLATTDLVTALFGTAVVVGGVILKKSADGLTRSVNANLTNLIEGVLTKKKTDVSGLIQLTSVFEKNMITFLKQLDADRAIIMQYHNGDLLSNSVSFLKASCTHEIFNPDCMNARIKPIQKDYINLPVSFFMYTINKTMKNAVHLIKDVEDVKQEDVGMYHRFKNLGMKGVALCALRDSEGKDVGTMTLCFNSIPANQEAKVKTAVKNILPKVEAMLEAMKDAESVIL